MKVNKEKGLNMSNDAFYKSYGSGLGLDKVLSDGVLPDAVQPGIISAATRSALLNFLRGKLSDTDTRHLCELFDRVDANGRGHRPDGETSGLGSAAWEIAQDKALRRRPATVRAGDNKRAEAEFRQMFPK